MTLRKKLDNYNEEQSSITPKRPLLSRDRIMGTFNDISPLSDYNSRCEQRKPIESIKNDQSSISTIDSCMFTVSPPQSSSRSTVIDDDDSTYIPVYTQRKARPAPSTTWKAPVSYPKSSTMIKTSHESLLPTPELRPPSPPIISFQPAIRARIPFNLSSINTIDKQAHAYTLWLNTLFTPVEFLCNTTVNQSITNEETTTSSMKTFKSLIESNRWYALRDRAREMFTHDIQSIATKISADIDIDHCRINPKPDLIFSARTVSRQVFLKFISSYNRTWFRLAMEILFPINIENYQQMKLAIDQYLIQSPIHTTPSINELNSKKTNLINSNNKTASSQIRLTMKNLLIIIIFLERAKILRLIDNDPCLYNRDSKFKSTKESLDVLSRDFISSDTNLLRRLKLAGYEPTYKQTCLDEYNYLITNTENKLFDDLKDGIRLTRCAQILLSSTNEHVARFDLSTKLKCPVVNLVHKLLNIDQAFELLQAYGHVNLTGISNKDIMNGNKQRTLELLWRIFTICYLPKHLSPIDKLNQEIFILSQNLLKFCSSTEQRLITTDIRPLQKENHNFTSTIHLLIKWVQLICAHYKFWLYDLQESFADGRAFLYIISYYFPSLCDYTRDIKHLTTLATCQTRDEHIQFNLELGRQQQPLINIYERNVKSNFRFLEECIKQFGTFSYDLIKYEYYAKDVPDERCTIMILAMLAHDLLFSNNENNNIRQQSIFEELKEKYSNNDDNEPIIEMKKEEIFINKFLNQQEIEIVRENLINSSEISLSNDTRVEELITLNYSNIYPTNNTHIIPIIQSESVPILLPSKVEEEEDKRKIIDLSQSVLDTMNYDILNRLEVLSEFNNNDDNDDEESFSSARSNSTRIDHHRTSIATTMATLSLDDFVELEKTIENEENKNNTSLCLIDETISSEVDSIELNKLAEASFVDPVNTKMIKETFTLFLSHQQQQTLSNEESINSNNHSNEQQSKIERETHAAEIVQAHWRGHQVRVDNERNDHPIVSILEKIRSHNLINKPSLTIRERMMQIVQEFYDASALSLTAYIHFLRDIEPIIACCVEIRYLIAQQGLLRLFFILMRCCNRSGPSTILLSKILHILQLFTVKHELILKLIDKQEQIKDFITLLLKYYQKNSCELFEQICFLLQTMVKDEKIRKKLRSNKSFTEAIEYVYKRIFNKLSVEDEKHRQQVRSTPKQSIKSIRCRTTSLNQTSISYRTPNMIRSSIGVQNENISKNLVSIEQFMKIFYCD
ncbi:unnamed protein product [Adineta steineri]|uniref:Calponin-homology (CH) domain-containing protein n=1 Tax=Adineta steineri TaxID=433720 RepID=A0A818MNS5_9BILA|nr:unnamed protein product [Adineta steineri]CAF3592239.1 unnamed protein product [Adineta steineri]